MTDAVIRPREDRDIDELARALVKVHALDGYPVEGVADPVAWLTFPDALGVWVAELDGHAVGHVALVPPTPGDEAANLWMTRSSAGPEGVAILARLFVAPEGRGHSLGRRLTETATQHAEQIGRRAVLDVMNKDKAAIRTYEALGWTSLGPIEHHHSGDKVDHGTAYVSPPRASEATH